MNMLLIELVSMGITDPVNLRKIAWMISNAVNGSPIEHHAADITAMTDQEIEIAIQQVQGGQ